MQTVRSPETNARGSKPPGVGHNAGVGGRSRLTFVVQARLTGEDISRRLHLRPTRVAERGDPVSRRTPGAGRRGHTTWEVASGLGAHEDPAAHLAALLPLVEPRAAALREMESAGATMFWSCLVTAKPTGNTLHFGPDVLARLAAVGVPFELDVYDSDGDGDGKADGDG